MDITDASKDWFTDTITLIFDGKFDESVAIAYCRKYYDGGLNHNFTVSDYRQPDIYKGLYNPGACTVQCKPTYP